RRSSIRPRRGSAGPSPTPRSGPRSRTPRCSWSRSAAATVPFRNSTGPASSEDAGFVALFGPERTTEAFVLDGKAVLRYRGAVDDQYGIGYAKDAPTKTYLVDAIEALLAGKMPAV